MVKETIVAAQEVLEQGKADKKIMGKVGNRLTCLIANNNRCTDI